MLEDLPVEVLQLVIGHLPAVSSIASLSQTSRRLHARLTADENLTYKSFVQRQFPSVKTPNAWKEVAESLTSSSRAWDRRAFVVRDCCPPETLALSNESGHGRRHTTGYAPALDSYDDFTSNSLSNRREIVAWGAAGRIYIRSSDKRSSTWRSIKFEDDSNAINDIIKLRLLRPHQRLAEAETIVYQRANGEFATLVAADNELGYDEYARFTNTSLAHSMAVSNDDAPLLALGSNDGLRIYQIHTPTSEIEPSVHIRCERKSIAEYRTRCMEFLNSTTVALATSFLDGSDHGSISLYDVDSASGGENATTPIWSCTPSQDSSRTRQFTHAIAALDHTCGNSGQLFLSGWNTGQARLHDTRSPQPWVSEWYDTVDTGQILSLAVIGHERFLAGSDQNGCLKTFDIRMSGDQRYSYLNAGPRNAHKLPTRSRQDLVNRPIHARRDFNAFLSVRRWKWEQLWVPLPMPKQHHNTINYSGSIYSLSIPSSTSPTVYAGIENHVLQLDFASTDDIEKGQLDALRGNLVTEKKTSVFDVACYERPRKGWESTDPVLLNKQAVWHELTSQPEKNEESEAAGWDRRWRLGDTRRLSWSRARGQGRGGRRGSISRR